MRLAFAFVFTFTFAACSTEQPTQIEESPALGRCIVTCDDGSNNGGYGTWTADDEAAPPSTCCDCRRSLPNVSEAACLSTAIDDQASEQCPDCNGL